VTGLPVTYFVIVDSQASNEPASAGDFTLTIETRPLGNGSTEQSPGRSCAAILEAQPTSDSGVYWVTTRANAIGDAGLSRVYCDMDTDRGGWTLIGNVSGPGSDIDRRWLVADRAYNNELLTPNVLTANNFVSLYSVELAVLHTSEIRFTNIDVTQWVRWPLPQGRKLSTWWNADAGHQAVQDITQLPVMVTNSDGGMTACAQNIYGIATRAGTGIAYPATELPDAGAPAGNDFCMAIGTLQTGHDGGGWYQQGEGFDAPDQSAWPNTSVGAPPFLHVWLR
jgi:hypothetical protein